jgi:hypothetical protein
VSFFEPEVPENGDHGPPSPPDGLGDAGRAEWMATFETAGWLETAVDERLVLQYAELADERAELRRVIGKDGRLARGSMGQPVSSPAVSQLRAVEAAMADMRAEMGTPPALRREQFDGWRRSEPDQLDVLKMKRALRLAQRSANGHGAQG